MKAIQTLRRIALLALPALAALCLASAASALPIDPGDGGDPNIPPPKPNLVIGSASITPGTLVNDWAITYTVTNRGNAASAGFHVAVQQDGTALLRDSSQAGLAAGASRSETIHILRTTCYIAVRFTADSTHVVAESNEFDNTRWATALTSTSCPNLPRYTVKAVSFYTNDESGWDWTGSDEPYWIFNGVGQNGSDRSTMSHVFGDIDTGDTGYFNADEGCMYLSCSGGTAPLGMGFNVEAWEHDLGQPQQTLANIAYAFHAVGGFYVDGGDALWLGTLANKVGDAIDYLASIGNDDLIASQSWTYSSTSLAAGAPTVGASFSDVRTFSDGDATYSLTLRVTRVG
jgi:CARDB